MKIDTEEVFLVLSYPTLRIFTDPHLSLSEGFLGAKFENYRISVACDNFCYLETHTKECLLPYKDVLACN